MTEGGWSTWWDDSLENCGRIWGAERPAWLPRSGKVTSLEFHLVGNVWFEDDAARVKAERRLSVALRSQLPAGLRGRARAFVKPSVDLLLTAMETIRGEIVDDGWGKRHGDPLLDAIRELVRYVHPSPRGGGPKRLTTKVSAATRERLLVALLGK